MRPSAYILNGKLCWPDGLTEGQKLNAEALYTLEDLASYFNNSLLMERHGPGVTKGVTVRGVTFRGPRNAARRKSLK